MLCELGCHQGSRAGVYNIFFYMVHYIFISQSTLCKNVGVMDVKYVVPITLVVFGLLIRVYKENNIYH